METIGGMLKSRVEKYGNRVMMKRKQEGQWKEISWNQFYEKVRNLGLALISMGIQAGDRVAIFSTNSPEWQMTDMASLSIGAADVPLYPTITAPQAEYILKDSGSRVVFVGSEDPMHRVLQVKGNLPDLMKVVTVDNTTSDNPDVITFDEMLKLGEKYADKGEFDRRLSAVLPDALCSIVYTSGTTGPPKGVMLTHNNFMSNVSTASDLIESHDDDVILSFLPLSHVLERMSGYYTAVYNGGTIAHAQSIDTLLEDIGDIKPHWMVSVPRLYEKVHAGVLANVEGEPPIKQKIFRWAVGVGSEVSKLITSHKPIPAGLKFKYNIANKLVFSKIYEKMGGRLRFFFSGGAPLAKEIAEFFHAMGITILEGYGLTETSPVLTVNRPEALRFGSVGQPIPEVEIKIAGDGEILAKGPNVMRGYFNKPEATAEVLVDGWFHTGDIGHMDKDNYLHITDRKKDLIVTAGGKNIAPQNIENQLKLDKYIEQVCVLGDKRKYLSALIVPNFEALEDWAKKEGIAFKDRMDLVMNEKVNKLYRERIDGQLKEFDRHEGITKFTLLPQEMTEDDGFLTPTLKVKRKEVSQAFANDIDKMYSE
ncbi:MAG: long-chain fatty acid--CoA ligase [Actinobacteria bacterium]|nr:long-chain fatty acid--CoA ligase [Actinomycetota bacterium]